MNLYKSCDTLPVYNFDKILDTQDLRFLIRDFDVENSDKVISEPENMMLSSIFHSILKDYEYMSNPSKKIRTEKKRYFVMELEAKIDIFEKSVAIYEENGITKHFECLSEIGFRFDLSKEVDVQVNRLKRKIRGLKTKLSIKKAKLKTHTASKENSTVGVDSSVFKTAISISRALGISHSIDVYTTNLTTWVNYLNECEKLKQ